MEGSIDRLRGVRLAPMGHPQPFKASRGSDGGSAMLDHFEAGVSVTGPRVWTPPPDAVLDYLLREALSGGLPVYVGAVPLARPKSTAIWPCCWTPAAVCCALSRREAGISDRKRFAPLLAMG